MHGHSEAAQRLVDGGADVDARDVDGPGRPENGADRVGSRSLGVAGDGSPCAEAPRGRGLTPWEVAKRYGQARRMAPVLRPVPWQCLSRAMGSWEESGSRGGKEKKGFSL